MYPDTPKLHGWLPKGKERKYPKADLRAWKRRRIRSDIKPPLAPAKENICYGVREKIE